MNLHHNGHETCMSNSVPSPQAGQLPPPSTQEAPIRTLSVSLLAVTAVAVGVLLTKQRQVRPAPEDVAPAGDAQPAMRTLDAIRAAGL